MTNTMLQLNIIFWGIVEIIISIHIERVAIVSYIIIDQRFIIHTLRLHLRRCSADTIATARIHAKAALQLITVATIPTNECFMICTCLASRGLAVVTLTNVWHTGKSSRVEVEPGGARSAFVHVVRERAAICPLGRHAVCAGARVEDARRAFNMVVILT